MSDGTSPAVDAPQLRTLLLTDLCDSTGLVEKLGDTAAAAFFRDHDHFVLELQQRWRGRLIDRSDGLLLLFERPLDGLGFALDYRRGLEGLGRSHGVAPLRARAGLHVGEVLIWRNSDEAVQAGAKSMEIEGLAKPLAARLMQLARPGQILLSAVAEPLVRRAARELGERGEALQWRSHGRWRFKGVPEAQEVHEVGERGLAPMRAPAGDAKARRDLPLWRRPAALAAEVLLVAGVGLAAWLLTRPEPAIAFSERDWVVVGDLRNLTGQTVLDDSLEQAFRISLEQSRYVNVLSGLKVDSTLQRMGLDPRTALVDRKVGAEVAIRDGARLLLLPTVSEVGGRLRVSVEVVQPESQRTLLVKSVDGRGMDTVLASMDQVIANLRGALGEELASIRQDSVPLPHVTTGNIDALRAFALGQLAHGRAEYDDAEILLSRAVQLDPEFALAYVGLVRAYNAKADVASGLNALRKANELRDRLPPREQLYIDAWTAEVDEPAQALDKWKAASKLYPDFFNAHINASLGLKLRNRYEEALDYATVSISSRSDLLALSWNVVGLLRLAMEDYAKAQEAFKVASGAGSRNASLGLANVLAAERRFDEAEEVLATAARKPAAARFDRVSILLDRGGWREAVTEAVRMNEELGPGSTRGRASMMPLAVAYWASGDMVSSGRTLSELTDQNLHVLASDAAPRLDQLEAAYMAASAVIFSRKVGRGGDLRKIVPALREVEADAAGTPVATMVLAVQAAIRLDSGDPAGAVSLLEPLSDGSEPLQVRALLAEALEADGRQDAALEALRWVASHRGRAYAELGCGYCQQPLNVYEATLSHLLLSELLSSQGRKADAEEELRRFDAAWDTDQLPLHLRKRREVLLGTLRAMGDMPIAS